MVSKKQFNSMFASFCVNILYMVQKPITLEWVKLIEQQKK